MQMDRRADALTAESIERALQIDREAGAVQAWLYLMQCGVLERTIHRVLVLNARERALAPPSSIVMLARSKTGLLGEGIIKATQFCNGPCCLATALRVCLDAAGIASRAEFRSISNRRDGRHRAWRGQREYGSERLRHVGRPGLRVRSTKLRRVARHDHERAKL